MLKQFKTRTLDNTNLPITRSLRIQIRGLPKGQTKKVFNPPKNKI